MGKITTFIIIFIFAIMIVVSILVSMLVGKVGHGIKTSFLSKETSNKVVVDSKWFDNDAKWAKVQRGEKLTYEEMYDPKMVIAIEKASIVAQLCNESKDTCYGMTNHHYYYLNPYEGEYFIKQKLPPFKPEDMYNFYTQERVRRVKVAVDKCNASLLEQCEVLLKTTL